ncbi:MAG: hypothetical protein JWM11_1747 [Planctomycetaceae bacterium]|nr:hypothetical protein [Planctomycetaceae bacterium]
MNWQTISRDRTGKSAHPTQHERIRTPLTYSLTSLTFGRSCCPTGLPLFQSFLALSAVPEAECRFSDHSPDREMRFDRLAVFSYGTDTLAFTPQINKETVVRKREIHRRARMMDPLTSLSLGPVF